MLQPVRTTAATATNAVSVAEAKSHCIIDTDDHDTLIGTYIEAAYDRLSGYAGVLGRPILSEGWEIYAYDWPVNDCIRLPFPNVTAVAVKYWDANNTEQTVLSSLYEVLEDRQSSFIHFTDDFTAPAVYDDREDAVTVEFTAGYGASSSDVPAAIRVAMMLMICDWFEHRSNVMEGRGGATPMPAGSERLIEPYRRNRL